LAFLRVTPRAGDLFHIVTRDPGRVHETWRPCVATVAPLDIEFRLRYARRGWRWT
jgi:hypothetical protein